MAHEEGATDLTTISSRKRLSFGQHLLQNYQQMLQAPSPVIGSVAYESFQLLRASFCPENEVHICPYRKLTEGTSNTRPSTLSGSLSHASTSYPLCLKLPQPSPLSVDNLFKSLAKFSEHQIPDSSNGDPYLSCTPATNSPNYAENRSDTKPAFSYIGLIAQAILSSTDRRMILSEIYQWIQLHFPYFRSRGPGWRNSIRHNLSLNDCFIKAGRATNGKGHYWSIHPANMQDFLAGDYRRRRAQRKVRQALGLVCAHDARETPSPSTVIPQPRKDKHRYQDALHPLLEAFDCTASSDRKVLLGLTTTAATTTSSGLSYSMEQLLPHLNSRANKGQIKGKSDCYRKGVNPDSRESLFTGPHSSVICSIVQQNFSVCPVDHCQSFQQQKKLRGTPSSKNGQNRFSVSRILEETFPEGDHFVVNPKSRSQISIWKGYSSNVSPKGTV